MLGVCVADKAFPLSGFRCSGSVLMSSQLVILVSVYVRLLKFFTEESTAHCVIIKYAECL